MKVFCTSRNTGPSWGSDPTILLYLGTDLEKAKDAVENFTQYEQDRINWPAHQWLKVYTALPRNIEFEMERLYLADGWWYSIASFELKESETDGG